MFPLRSDCMRDYRTYDLSVCLSSLCVCNVGVLWPNGWMDQAATWYGGRPRLGDIVIDGALAPPRKGAERQPPLLFGPFCSGSVAHHGIYAPLFILYCNRC